MKLPGCWRIFDQPKTRLSGGTISMGDNKMLRAGVIMSWFALSLTAAQSNMAAQSKTPAFEVVSVKRAPEILPGSNGHGSTGFGVSSDAAFVRYSGVSLQWLIMTAFETNEFAVRGPAWIGVERYEVVAKLPEGANKSEIPAMLRQLLFERFHLVVRQEEKRQKDYAMVVGKSGLLLRSASGINVGRSEQFGIGSSGLKIINMSLDRLAEILGRLLKRRVVNSAAIEGRFDGLIPLPPSAVTALMSGGDDVTQPDSDGDPIGALVAALQTVGLNLVQRDSSVRLVEVVSVDKAPTSN